MLAEAFTYHIMRCDCDLSATQFTNWCYREQKFYPPRAHEGPIRVVNARRFSDDEIAAAVSHTTSESPSTQYPAYRPPLAASSSLSGQNHCNTSAPPLIRQPVPRPTELNGVDDSPPPPYSSVCNRPESCS
ncbi:unnamed protein product [Anisakis simplex]|uniref:Uncharacterized protein n=1 Tax=Anisakis simplex TaxID=6269 RepID=A0A0M3KDZ3_ANISI|nr:unnamed protein product [Anisakis simplex]